MTNGEATVSRKLDFDTPDKTSLKVKLSMSLVNMLNNVIMFMQDKKSRATLQNDNCVYSDH